MHIYIYIYTYRQADIHINTYAHIHINTYQSVITLDQVANYRKGVLTDIAKWTQNDRKRKNNITLRKGKSLYEVAITAKM